MAAARLAKYGETETEAEAAAAAATAAEAEVEGETGRSQSSVRLPPLLLLALWRK